MRRFSYVMQGVCTIGAMAGFISICATDIDNPNWLTCTLIGFGLLIVGGFGVIIFDDVDKVVRNILSTFIVVCAWLYDILGFGSDLMASAYLAKRDCRTYTGLYRFCKSLYQTKMYSMTRYINRRGGR